ncbi:M949_RS01915 family surface polysaccharide biosynthesis protein [Polaribacter sp. 11A2H]|uniref:M949_RS01915 family surface polysaccharide biosynthesis protein n=1 Tax=Polaribacter sp. 11A2H TaxID=2687290 RepID=UPI00140B2A84|nr:hypothetical protein [Polaribacter sp. 11A2H]
MKRTLLILLFLCSNISFAQNKSIYSKKLSAQEVKAIFSEDLKNKLKIEYSINRVYEFNDNLGKHYLLLTVKETKCGNEYVNCNKAIKAYCIDYKNNNYHLKWNLNDFILPNGNEVSEEFSISFWTKFLNLSDVDANGIIDPIIVYGTKGLNDFSDGRIKIVVYNRGKKVVIRHQNGISDYERIAKVDAGFYRLPYKIQLKVKEIMNNIEENNFGIFPYKWQNNMKSKKLILDES